MTEKLTFVDPKKDIPLQPHEVQISFPDKKKVIFDSQVHFQNVIEQQKLRKEGEASQNSCEVNVDTSLPFILIAGTGDWHLGSEHTDYVRFQHDMELIKNTQGAYMIVVGDERDNFVNPKLRAGLFEGVLNPQQQADMHLGVLMDMNDKILARAGGNHTSWTWYQCGISVENYWQDGMHSPLLRNGGFVHLKLNQTDYLGYIHHGLTKFNSSFNPNHASRRAFEFQGPFDFMFSGHVHQSEIAHGYRWSDEYMKDCVMCRTGTYKLDDQYARMMQMGRGQPPGACILFSTTERRMIPFAKLEDGVDALKALVTFTELVAAGMLAVK